MLECTVGVSHGTSLGNTLGELRGTELGSKLGESLGSELESKLKQSLVTELGIKVTPVLEAVLCRELEYVKCAWKICFARHWGSARLYSLECHLGHRLVVSLEGHLVQSWKDNSRNH